MGLVSNFQPTFNTILEVYQFEDRPDFTPSYSPVEMTQEGVFGGNYFGNAEVNREWTEWVPKEFLLMVDKHFSANQLINPKYDKGLNKYGVICGMDYQGWTESGWIREQDPYGWFNWYINFFYGRRSEDDNRQIARWNSFIKRHSAMLGSICKKKGLNILDESIGLKTRQGLLHWAHKIK